MPSRASGAGTNIQVVAIALRLILRPRIDRLHNKWVAAPQPAIKKILLCELCFTLHNIVIWKHSTLLTYQAKRPGTPIGPAGPCQHQRGARSQLIWEQFCLPAFLTV